MNLVVLTTTIYHELTTTTIVSQGIRRTIRASESPQSGYSLGSSGPAGTDRCGCKVLLISRFQVRVLGGSLEKECVLQEKRDDARSPRWSVWGLFTATGSILPFGLTPQDRRARQEAALSGP